MRIRQIKPGWWLDKELRRGLCAAAREFYVGLWCVADDAGWLEWDLEKVAAELYPYGVDPDGGLFGGDMVAGREDAVSTWSKQLAALSKDNPHLVIYPCGHARLPKLTSHQKLGGRPVHTVRDRHARDCARLRADARGGRGRVGEGYGKGSDGSQAINDETTDGLKDRLGDFASVIGSESLA